MISMAHRQISPRHQPAASTCYPYIVHGDHWKFHMLKTIILCGPISLPSFQHWWLFPNITGWKI
jgi:hypothetical protein